MQYFYAKIHFFEDKTSILLHFFKDKISDLLHFFEDKTIEKLRRRDIKQQRRKVILYVFATL